MHTVLHCSAVYTVRVLNGVVHVPWCVQGHVECEGPNPFMYEFTGNLALQGQR